jgi:nicotinate-nucleotide--dimethylbenzimidazole phosphoribosyltransferase
MTTFRATCAAIQAPDAAAAEQTRGLLDRKTKPRGSLGRLEELACQLASIAGTPRLELPVKAIVVMGGDHGVAENGVSAYPQEVTAQMFLNFARGGAAINVLARQAGAEVVLVDMGVKGALPALPEIRSHRLAPGTDNFTRGPAMSRERAIAAIEIGIGIAGELADRGVSLLGLGEMGIGNSTAASALTAALTGAAPEEVIGRGTGVDEAGLHRKLDAVRRGLAINRPEAGDGLDALAKLGGFEIAGLCGVVLGAAARRVPVVVDGFICGAAALCAVRIAPACAPYLIASHRSAEAGHRIVLQSLETRPLLDLELRLGEGTGAALAMGLCEASVRILREMASFEAAGVSDSGA